MDNKLTYGEISDDVLQATQPPRRRYYGIMALFIAGFGWAFTCWMYQVRTGMGVTGLSIPMGWGVYIVNFVFWVGIAHSGTLISAILHLVRSRWRTAVARSAEAMTVFAVMTAGLFPLIHLGRLWVFYYILPYPSQRQLWPNFMSPLVWDVVAVGTYLTVSSIFWFVGLIPDLASARDRSEVEFGPDHPRTKFYRTFALGWSGSGNQWRHYGRAYLFFAALATPLVISVHSVVSWDFAMSLLPGWHTTIFPPYFVAGAIHSGLAMVLTLLIPMRRILQLERVIRLDHLESVAQTMIVTTLIMGYAYLIEPFLAWYTGDPFERQFAMWRAFGEMAPFYWAMLICNVAIPILFVFRRARRSLLALFVISIFVNIGMWLERFVIFVGSLSHDFMPHNWHGYAPTWVEVSITLGAFAWFLFLFFGFAKTAPTVSISDVKEDTSEGSDRYYELDADPVRTDSAGKANSGVLAVYAHAESLIEALRKVRGSAFTAYEMFSPVRLREAEVIMGRGPSPVRLWTLVGAITGLACGFWLAIGTALVNGLVVGGKPPVSIIPYCVIGFECTILFGTIFNFTGTLVHTRLGRPAVPACYDRRFSRDRFGLFIACPAEKAPLAKSLLSSTSAEEVHVV